MLFLSCFSSVPALILSFNEQTCSRDIAETYKTVRVSQELSRFESVQIS